MSLEEKAFYLKAIACKCERPAIFERMNADNTARYRCPVGHETNVPYKKVVRLEDVQKHFEDIEKKSWLVSKAYQEKIQNLEARLEQARQLIQEELELNEIFIVDYESSDVKNHRGYREAKDDRDFLRSLLAVLEGKQKMQKIENIPLCFNCRHIDPVTIETMAITGMCIKKKQRKDLEHTGCPEFELLEGKQEKEAKT